MELNRESIKVLANEQICWSADVTARELEEVIRSEALPKGTMIKLDQVFFERYGRQYISRCQEAGYPVFADRKISEIPDKAIEIAKVYLEDRPFMLNVMAGICSTGKMIHEDPKKIDALARFAELCEEVGTKSCAVTVLTSKAPSLVREEFGRPPEEQVRWYADVMALAGLTDIVCSAKEAKMLSECMQKDEIGKLTINTPGIRLPNTDARDQARIMTPVDAFESGADRLVIGSNLTDGEGEITERLARNYKRLVEHLEGAKFYFNEG